MKKFLLFLFVSVLLLSGCNQNMEVVSSGETLDNSPKPVADPSAKPLAAAAADGEGEAKGAGYLSDMPRNKSGE